MWRVNNYQGEQIWYEAELIDAIRKECQEMAEPCIECKHLDCENCVFDTGGLAERVLEHIKSYEGER